MQIQITATPDPALIAAAVRRGLRRPVLAFRYAGWTVLLAALVVQLTTGRLAPFLLAGGVGLAVLVPMLLINISARGAERTATTYQISESGVASSSAQSSHAYAWRAFRSVERLPGQLVFRRSDTQYLPVPTAGLTPGQVEHVLALAATNGVAVQRP
ncbi:YcxB family protein [Actinoplanes sp. NPDC024001]|uniref:YcxB family protein n=1 Tax=Actinoplanes sp. NPDC024001 TaxID=3154598 RepID=UPI0033DBA086